MGTAGEEVAAAADALATYLTSVLPRARRQLRLHGGSLPAGKAANVQAVSVLAITAPAAARAGVVRAICALQIAIDHLDVLEEAETDAEPSPADASYLRGLREDWRREVASLPSGEALLPQIEAVAERCANGQRHTHAAARGDAGGLRRWAEGLDQPPGYRWWEVAAGASSSVAAHALIAAAADPSTNEKAAGMIEAAYFPPIGALTVLLDDLVDREADLAAGEHNYLSYYRDAEEAAGGIAHIGVRALAAIETVPHPRRHAAILAGIAGFYLSTPAARAPFASPIADRLGGTLGPAVGLLAAFSAMRRRL